MKKSITAVALVLVLLLASLSAASAGGAIRDLEVSNYDATSIGVSWTSTDPDGPLFTITCQAEGTDRSTERRTYHDYCTINYLSPGTTYVITVTTKNGASATTTFTLPVPGNYTDFNYQLLDTGVYQSTAYEENYAAVTTLNSATLSDTLRDDDFSFLLHFNLSATRQNKYLDFELVLSLPNDDVYTLSDVLWYAAGRTAVSEYYTFNSALKSIYKDYGSFPAGEYTLTAYIDNGIAGQATFTME